MKYTIKTVLRILFALSCSHLMVTAHAAGGYQSPTFLTRTQSCQRLAIPRITTRDRSLSDSHLLHVIPKRDAAKRYSSPVTTDGIERLRYVTFSPAPDSSNSSSPSVVSPLPVGTNTGAVATKTTEYQICPRECDAMFERVHTDDGSPKPWATIARSDLSLEIEALFEEGTNMNAALEETEDPIDRELLEAKIEELEALFEEKVDLLEGLADPEQFEQFMEQFAPDDDSDDDSEASE